MDNDFYFLERDESVVYPDIRVVVETLDQEPKVSLHVGYEAASVYAAATHLAAVGVSEDDPIETIAARTLFNLCGGLIAENRVTRILTPGN